MQALSQRRDIEKALGFFRALLLPLFAVLDPKETYARLKHVVTRSSPFVKAMLAIWSYIGFAFLSMLAVFLGSIYYSITHVSSISLGGIFGGMWSLFKAMVFYPFLVPLLLAGLDTALILVPAHVIERGAPNYLGILLIRFSSLIGYAIKPGLIVVTESPQALSLSAVYAASPDNPLSLAILSITYLLTAYGLVKSGGLKWSTALTAAAVPTLAHLLVGTL